MTLIVTLLPRDEYFDEQLVRCYEQISEVERIHNGIKVSYKYGTITFLDKVIVKMELIP